MARLVLIAILLLLAIVFLLPIAHGEYDVIPVTVVPSSLPVVVASPLPPPPAIITIEEVTNSTVGTAPIPLAIAVNYTIVTLNITPLLAVTLVVPSEVTTCYPAVTLTIYTLGSGGGPVAGLNITYTVVELNETEWVLTDSSGVAVVTLTLPSRGVYHVYYYVYGMYAGSTTINYVVCFGAAPGVGLGGVSGYLNVSKVLQPVGVGVPELNRSFELASRPRLDTPTGVVVAALLGSLWAWMSRKTGVSYATVVTGFVLAAIGAAFSSQGMIVAGALMMAGGVVLRALGLTS